jgi:gliding motility-associated-like protein
MILCSWRQLLVIKIAFALVSIESSAQQIIDPCFQSVTALGKFLRSEDLTNACMSCPDPYEGADLVEWNGTEWVGSLPHADIKISPPPGCNIRAMWIGYQHWTTGGEGIGLRLDKPLVAGVKYQFTFTYASAGGTGDGHFSPKIYTNSTTQLRTAFYTGRLPGVNYWRTNTFVFTAQSAQAGHTWIFLHAYESSGMVLAQCDVRKLFPDSQILGEDILACEGDRIELTPPLQKNYQYYWNTGSYEPTQTVTNPGEYWVNIQYGNCESADTVAISMQDCEVRLVMPNVFTPNRDTYNEKFIPKEHNFIDSGITRIYNRWGKEVFTGDLFEGWNGKTNTGEILPGVYYFAIDATDKKQRKHIFKGYLTLLL